MANLQYIGARYVPKFYQNSQDPSSMEWEQGVFEALIIVTYNGDTYTSKIPVPANIGNPAANPTYWAKTGSYNAAMEAINNRIDSLEEELENVTIDRWYQDNAKENNMTGTPADLTYTRITKMAANFSDFLETDAWIPNPDWSEEVAIRGAGTGTSSLTCTVLNNGVSVAQSGVESTTTFKLTHIFERRAKMFVQGTFKKYGGSSTHRVGFCVANHSYVYINNDNTIHYEVDEGATTQLNARVFNVDTDITLMLGYNGESELYVWAKEGDEPFEYMGSVTTPSTYDSQIGIFGILRSGQPTTTGIVFKNLRTGFTYDSFADCKYIHYDDTTPFISDNKAYLTATLKSHGGVAITGVLKHTLGYNDLQLIGTIIVNGDQQGLGTDLMFDRDSKKWYGVFRLQDTFEGEQVDCCAYGSSYFNNLGGINYFKATKLDRVADDTDFGNFLNDEDPAICKFDGKWYIAINRKSNDIHSTYYYNIYRSDSEEFDITSFEYVGTALHNSLTGGSFLAVYDRLYLVAGDGTSISVFDATSGALLGSLPMTMASRVWGNLTCINRGSYSKFYLTTFDRTLFGEGSHSYGNVIMYESADSNRISELVTGNTYGTR